MGSPSLPCTPTVAGYDPTLRSSQVAVVYNGASPDSFAIAKHYARRRSVPTENLITLNTTVAFDVGEEVFENEIAAPIVEALDSRSLWVQVRFVAIVFGVPHVVMRDTLSRIDIVGGVTVPEASPSTTNASVDSELAARLGGQVSGGSGHIANPYFQSGESLDPATHGVMAVTRLAVAVPDVDVVAATQALIDRALCAEATAARGRFALDAAANACWDLNPTGGNAWITDAAVPVEAAGYEAVVDTEATVLRDLSDVAGYASWGSNDRDAAIDLLGFCIDGGPPGFGWVDGALAVTFVSTSARLADKALEPGIPVPTVGQSTIWDLLNEGATGAAGHVLEPYLDSVPRPAVLFERYLAGATLAEAFYAAIPYLSWMTVVVGDPLAAPYASP